MNCNYSEHILINHLEELPKTRFKTPRLDTFIPYHCYQSIFSDRCYYPDSAVHIRIENELESVVIGVCSTSDQLHAISPGG